MKKSSLIDHLLICIIIVGANVILPLTNNSKIATFILIPFCFIYLLFRSNKNITQLFKVPIKYFLGFFAWTTIASLYANDIGQAVYTQRKFLLVIIYCITLYIYMRESENNIKLVYLWHIVVLILAIISVYMIKPTYEVEGADRLTDSGMNANSYGYFVFSGISSAYFLFIMTKKNIFKVVSIIVLIILSFLLILLSASRGGIIIFTLTVSTFTIITLTYGSNFGPFKRVFTFLIVLLLLLYGGLYVYDNIIMDSYLADRFLMLEEQEPTRIFHIKNAIEIGLNNPLGVGGGNYAVIPRFIEPGSFSHCSFTEAFACYGYLGLILLCSLYYLAFKITLRIKLIKDKNIKYLLLFFFIIFCVYNVFYVTYLNIVFMGIFITTLTHALLVYNNSRKLKQQLN